MTPSPLRKLANHLRTSKDNVLSFGEDDRFSMKELVMPGNYEDFATDFCEFLEAVKKNESVTTLKLEVNERLFRWGAGFWLFNTLCRHLPNAKTLQIEQHNTDACVPDSALLLRGTERFEEILLRFNGEFRWRWLKEHSKLQILDLEIYGFTTSLVSIAKGLMPLSSLKEVAIDCDEVTDNVSRDSDSVVEDAAAIAAFFRRPSVRKLRIPNVKCTNGGITDAFARGISASSIQDLTVNFHEEAGASQMARICQGIVNCSNLRELSMFREFSPSPEVPLPLTQLFRSNQELRYLVLANLDMAHEDLQALAGVLRDGTRPLTVLDLDSAFSAEDVCLLLAAAKESPHLEHLKVYHSADSAECQRRIYPHVEALWDTPCLRNLIVNSHGSLETGAERNPELFAQFVERFSQSFTLELISLDCLDDDSHLRLNTICALNRAGRRYLESRHPSKADGVEVLAKHCTLCDDEMLDFLYTHLRENPSLCSRHCDDHDSSQDGPGSLLRSTSRQGTKRALEDAVPSTLD